MDFEYVGNAYKIKLKWNTPNPSTGLSGYYLFRKFGADGEYTRIKLLGANATSYTDNSATQEGDYYYQLYAYYGSLDCTSAPANWIYDHNQFYLKVLYSADGVNEVDGKDVSVFPNPTTNRFTVEGEGLNHVSVYNTLGQMVYDMDCHGESVDNTSETFVAPWLEAVKEIRPQQVMIYTIDRETPTQGLLKATHEQLDAIRDRVIAEGIPCTASY
jgi:hypothetical protein